MHGPSGVFLLSTFLYGHWTCASVGRYNLKEADRIMLFIVSHIMLKRGVEAERVLPHPLRLQACQRR